jgi:hypothetical protein
MDKLFESTPIFTLEVFSNAWRVTPADSDEQLCESCVANVLQDIVNQIREYSDGCDENEDGENEIDLSE